MNTELTGASITRAIPSHKSWWSYLLWIPATAIIGFAIPAIFAGILGLPRNIYLVPYFIVTGTLIYAYLHWSKINIGVALRYHWIWGIIGAIVAGFFGSRTVLLQESSPAPQGFELAYNLVWLGFAYGAVDALFLTVLPLSAAWQAFVELGWTKRWSGRIAAGALTLLTSLLIIAVYHLGYPEFRGPQIGMVVVGVGIQSLLALLTGSPIVVILGHIAMHITAVLYGFSSVSQLPPHY